MPQHNYVFSPRATLEKVSDHCKFFWFSGVKKAFFGAWNLSARQPLPLRLAHRGLRRGPYSDLQWVWGRVKREKALILLDGLPADDDAATTMRTTMTATTTTAHVLDFDCWLESRWQVNLLDSSANDFQVIDSKPFTRLWRRTTYSKPIRFGHKAVDS